MPRPRGDGLIDGVIEEMDKIVLLHYHYTNRMEPTSMPVRHQIAPKYRMDDLGLSAKERNAARYRLEDGLEAWMQRWELLGHTVRCQHCHAMQRAGKSTQAFSHASGCANTGEFAQHPWRELGELLEQLPEVTR